MNTWCRTPYRATARPRGCRLRLTWPLSRKLILAGRRLERLMIGAYRPRSITYRYAVDARPTYIEVTAEQIGGRITVEDIRGRPAAIRTVDSA
jgi:hypothetical protein